MGDVMKPLANSPVFISMIEQVSDIPVLGVLVGTLMTVVVQSSSATIAVLQNFASQAGPDGISSIIGLQGAIPILFGDNIGTTITALLAAIGQSKNAQRTALSHSIFNICGTFLFIWFIPQFAAIVQAISPSGAEVEVISRQIANAHTLFNITNTLIWIPLLPVMVKIVTTVIKGDDTVEAANKERLVYIDERLLDQPEFAMHLVMQEIGRVNTMVGNMMIDTRRNVLHNDKNAIEAVLHAEDSIDNLNSQIVNYMSTLFTTGHLNEVQSVRLAGIMEMASNVERISDSCASIVHKMNSKMEKGLAFSDYALEELAEAFELVGNMVDHATNVLKDGNKNAAETVLYLEAQINQLEHRLRKQHLTRLNEGVCSPDLTVTYTEILHNLERIGDYCANIAGYVIDTAK